MEKMVNMLLDEKELKVLYLSLWCRKNDIWKSMNESINYQTEQMYKLWYEDTKKLIAKLKWEMEQLNIDIP